MKKMWLWAVVAIFFVSSLAVFAGCEKREYVEVYEVREGNWAYSDKVDRKSTRLNSSHSGQSRMPSSA